MLDNPEQHCLNEGYPTEPKFKYNTTVKLHMLVERKINHNFINDYDAI